MVQVFVVGVILMILLRAWNLFLTLIIPLVSPYNIGDPRSVITTLGLAQTVCRVLKSKSKIEHLPELSADVELRVPNIDKAKRDISITALAII